MNNIISQSETDPCSTPQVSEQLQILVREIEDNATIIQTLEDRLSDILSPSAGEQSKACSHDAVLVPLADKLRSAFKNERANNIRLRAILSAIAL